MIDEFEELVFQAKFLARTQEVMKRIGADADGYEKLSMEFQSGLQRAIEILSKLVGRAPAELAQNMTNAFIITGTNDVDRSMNLLSDLELIKNWQIDGKLLPYEINSSKYSDAQNNSHFQFAVEKQEEHMRALSRVRRSAAFAIIFYILFLLIDPPVTVIGLILSLGIAAFLAYIVLQLYVLKRIRKP